MASKTQNSQWGNFGEHCLMK